jgi:uncharacterized protein (DUF2147 family)
MKKLISILLLCCTTLFVTAQVDKLLGYWTSIDDATGAEESVFQIFKASDGLYYGKLVKLLLPERKGAVCDKCEGADHNKPLEGLILMRGLKVDGDVLSGGKIIDPKSGKVYNVKVSFDEKKNKLKVRGSLDKSGLLGRTQYWVRRKTL